MNIQIKIKSDTPKPPEFLETLRKNIQNFVDQFEIQTSITIGEIPEDGRIIIVNQNGLPENVYSNIESMLLPPIIICDLDSDDSESDFQKNPERLQTLNEANTARNNPEFRVVS